MKRPIRIALPPWRSKKPSTRSSRGRGDADARAVRDQEAPPEAAAEPEAREVAERGRAPGDQQHQRQVDAALGRDHAAEHDRGLARGDQADERAGLEEREPADERVGPGAERVGEVGQRALEVGRRDDAGLHEREQRGAHEPDAEERDAMAVATGGGHGRVAHAGLRAGSGAQRGAAAGFGAGSSSPASSAPQRATVRRRLPSAARPTGAGSQIASAR